MVSIKWCLNQKDGIRLIEPNENLSIAYLKMADNALGTMNRERNYNLSFAISACYYSMYYSLYALLMKIGIKCEIHSCTLEFMKSLLDKHYTTEEIKDLNKSFNLRNLAQYYADRVIEKKDSDYIMQKAPLFIAKSKEIASQLNERDIKEIRNKIEAIK